jgi:hypothetical protein
LDSSRTGQFIQPDAITPGGPYGLNSYSYGLNNPSRYTDPTGHVPSECRKGEIDSDTPICKPHSRKHSPAASPDDSMPLDPSTQNDLIVGTDNRRDAFYQAVLRHRSELPYGFPAELLLAMGAAESGAGHNWGNEPADLGNYDGVLQVNDASGWKWQSGPSGNNMYMDNAIGYDNNVRDAIGYLNELSGWKSDLDQAFTGISSANAVKDLLYYNGGSDPVALYANAIPGVTGNQNYLSSVAGYLESYVPKNFGSQYANPGLVADLRAAQKILNGLVANHP